MSSSIVTNRAATAFKSPSGETIWCLFEKVYSSNVIPRIPEWNCVCIGNTESVLQTVFQFAHYCEGGMVQTPKGRISPEDYIDRWMKALRNPIKMPDLQISPALAQGRESWGAHWAEEQRAQNAAVAKRLRGIGRGEMATALEKGETLPAWSLHADADLVCAVYSKDGLRPWDAIGHKNAPVPPLDSPAFKADRCPELGYRPAQAEHMPTPVIPNMCRIDGENRLIERDGQWERGGWRHSIVGEHIANLWRQELEAPGSYRALIGAFREAVEAAPLVQAGTVAVVDLSTLDQSDRDRVTDIARKHGGEVSDMQATIPWKAPKEPHGFSDLDRLPATTTWQVVLDAEQSLEADLAQENEDEREASQGMSR